MKAEMKIEDCELVKASLKFHLLITLFLENNIISVNCIKKVDNSVLLSWKHWFSFNPFALSNPNQELTPTTILI